MTSSSGLPVRELKSGKSRSSAAMKAESSAQVYMVLNAKPPPNTARPSAMSAPFKMSVMSDTGRSTTPFMIIAAPAMLLTAALLGTRKKNTAAEMTAMAPVSIASSLSLAPAPGLPPI